MGDDYFNLGELSKMRWTDSSQSISSQEEEEKIE
jgi:hypothetical protein